VEEIVEDSAANTAHRHAQAQAVDSSRWMSKASQCGRQEEKKCLGLSIASQGLSIANILAYRQLMLNYRQVINRNHNRESVDLSLSIANRDLSITTGNF